MKKVEWINGNKMKFVSGHKAFDSQCNCLDTGNVYANTQYSSFVRSWNDDGKSLNLLNWTPTMYEPGHLFKFDTNSFKESFPEFKRIEKGLAEESKQWKESHILYAFFHHNGSRKVLHGFILTDYNHNHIKTYYFGTSYKSEMILLECKKYICNE